eukprot:733780-Prorocentrum_minimum.AAC.1
MGSRRGSRGSTDAGKQIDVLTRALEAAQVRIYSYIYSITILFHTIAYDTVGKSSNTKYRIAISFARSSVL